MKVVTVEEMRQIEAASDGAGHSYEAMMEQAGRAVAEAITQRRAVQGKAVLVLVGPGNNGGDGLVAARYLAEAGARVACYLLKPRDRTQDANFRLVQEEGLEIVLVDDESWSRLDHLTQEADVIVDGLLGTGARPPLRGRAVQTLNRMCQTVAARREIPRPSLTPLVPTTGRSAPPERPLVVAIDGPSGLDYDTGDLDEAALPADLSVTFAYPKVGHFCFPGAGALGELVVADIGTDPALADGVQLEVVTAAMVREWLGPRQPDAHKGSYGKAMILAGSVNYTGAAYLAGAAATRSGAGLVTLALPATIHTIVAARLAEATYLPLPCDERGLLTGGAAQELSAQLAGYSALLFGPGLGQARQTTALVEALLGEIREEAGPTPPVVVDADGLNILARAKNWPELLPAGSILTPHPGEMARLMPCSTAEVQADRLAVARSQATAWDQVVVLKGAHTVVAAPDGRTVLLPFANPGLATGGTGDVLAGTIVALRAQSMGAFEAAAAGAYVHGLAGELARQALGAVGMVAGDVLAHLPAAFQRILTLQRDFRHRLAETLCFGNHDSHPEPVEG
jgi:NAD(P)H-hydrate epimerase